jgi:sugar-specific transcriptional regulator TrmB
MMILEKLKELDLSEGQIKVYSAVLELGIGSLNSIQEKTGIERRNIYDILNKLIERGLISYTLEKGKRTYQSTNPSKIEEEVKRKMAALKELEKQLPSLHSSFNSTKPDTRAEVFRGNESIKSLLKDVLDYTESFWIGGNGFEQYKAVPENLQIWFEHWMRERAEKKHIMHDLVSHGSYLKGLEPNKKSKHKKEHYEYKELPEGMYTPMVIVIFGNKVAQIIWGEQSFAFVLESDKIKKSYMKYFDYFWKNTKK